MPRAVNIIGVPFDGAVLGRRGAAHGPAGIRQAMSGFSNYNVELGMRLEGSRVFDLGDLEVDAENVFNAHEEIEREVSQCLREDSLLALLGGDNSISLPALKAVAWEYEKIGLVAIDSHFDLRGEIGGKPTSGSSYGLAVEHSIGLDPKRVVEVGIHGFLNSEKYAKKAERLGISIMTASDVRERGPTEAAKEAFRTASKGANAVYLSVDMDAVDLAQVSGVSAPNAGGIRADELFELVYNIAGEVKVRCADIVEIAPSLDPTGRSQVVAATALTYMLAGFQNRRPTKKS